MEEREIISEELLSELHKCLDLSKYKITYYDKYEKFSDEMFGDIKYNVSYLELQQLCKEFAYTKGYCLISGKSTWKEGYSFCQVLPKDCYEQNEIGLYESDECYINVSEYQAVIDATQYIYDITEANEFCEEFIENNKECLTKLAKHEALERKRRVI